MTKYKHCSISYASLHNREVVIFYSLKLPNGDFKLIGLPISGQYNEVSGLFTYVEEEANVAYDMISQMYKKHYDEEFHGFSFDSLINGNTSVLSKVGTFVVLKDVFEAIVGKSLHEGHVPLFRKEIIESIIREAELAVSTFSILKMLDKNDDLVKENPFYYLLDEQLENLITRYTENKNEKELFSFIDGIRTHKEVKFSFTEIYDQPSLNFYLKEIKFHSLNDILSLYLKAIIFRTIIETLIDRPVSVNNSEKQGRDIEYSIDYFESIIKGLKQQFYKEEGIKL